MISGRLLLQVPDRSDYRDGDAADDRPVRRVPRVAAGQRGHGHPAGLRDRLPAALGFLPGALRGSGFRRTTATRPRQRTDCRCVRDSPTLLRQAPNTWNISPDLRSAATYSMRAGYQLQRREHLRLPVPEPEQRWDADRPGDLTAGGVKGPGGDIYLYPHLQFDVQGTVHVASTVSVVAYGLNLNNEVFGFYNGSPRVRPAARVLQADVRRRRPVEPRLATEPFWAGVGRAVRACLTPEPLKTAVVPGQRPMTTWVMRRMLS